MLIRINVLAADYCNLLPNTLVYTVQILKVTSGGSRRDAEDADASPSARTKIF